MDYLNLTSFFLGILAIGVSLYWWFNKRKFNLPPGPWCLPIVGHLPFVGKERFKVFKQLSEKYGKVFSLYLGPSYTIVLNDFESVKNAYNNPAILDRPPNIFNFAPDGLGFAGQNGDEWIEQRRYTMRTLKDIGMGKIPWEADVEAEIEDFIKLIEKQAGKPVDLRSPLSVSVSNNMTSIVLGKRLLKGDPRRSIVDEGVQTVIETFIQGGIVSVFPNLLKIIAWFGISKFAEDYKKMQTFNQLMKNEVELRKKVSPDQREEIFIDGYLTEIHKSREKDTKTFYNEYNLVGIAKTLVIGGSETSRTSLLWLFLAMVTYPEVQKKVQAEIDLTLGRDGKVQWSERAKLPYTYATIMEGQRWRTVSPLGVLRRVSENTTVGGYDVPKGANILSNAWAIHNDPKYWKDPESFIPDRFLEKDGSLVTQKLDSYIPFSMGRRNCPGEIVAVIEIFRYFIAILQKFHVLPLENKPPNLKGTLGATYQPISQKLRFLPRG